MTTRVRLPSLGESVEGGRIVTIHVSVGDDIAAEDPVLEIETDKASLDVPAEQGGRVAELLVSEGDDVSVGQDVIVLESAGGDAESDSGREAAQESSEGESAAEAEAAAEGADEPAAEEEGEPSKGRAEPPEDTDERPDASAEQDQPGATQSEDQEVDVDHADQKPAEQQRQEAPERPQAGSAEGRDSDSGSRDENAEADGRQQSDGTPRSSDSPKARSDTDGAPVAAPPRVRRMARELDVDLADVAAEDASRITEADLLSHVRDRLRRSSRGGGVAEAALPDFEQWGPVEREPMDAVRRTIAQTVAESWRRIPQVTHFDTASVASLMEFRARHAADEDSLSFTAIVARILAEVLGQFPRVNASYDERSAEIVLKRSVHLGIAVDTERGLLVPVLRDVQDLGIADIDTRLRGLIDDARSGSLKPDQLSGATFTLSNQGSLGGSYFTPLVLWPQVAILGLGVIEPRIERGGDGAFTESPILPLSLSYDHRVLDGADAARFTRRFADSLENPLNLWMDR